MSREERRAYQRMTKKQDPYALPASGPARARLQRQERIKAQRAAKATAAPGSMSRRFLLWAIGGAALSGLVAFSLAWPRMPLAAFVAAGVAAAWIVAAFAIRVVGARTTARH